MQGLVRTILLGALYAVGVGLSIRALRFVWQRVFGVEISAREGNLFAGLVIGFLVGFRLVDNHSVGVPVAVIVVAGGFATKLIMSVFDRFFPPERKP